MLPSKENELLMSLWAVPLPLPGLESYNGFEICWCLVICPQRELESISSGSDLHKMPDNERKWSTNCGSGAEHSTGAEEMNSDIA